MGHETTKHFGGKDQSVDTALSEHEVLSSNEEVLALRRRVGELEARLEAREAQFRRAVELLREDKQAALMKLAGSISHDISNVLVAVLGFSDLLLGKLSTDDPTARSIRMIQDSGNRGVELSRQLLDYSRRRRGENAAFDPDATIGEVMEILPLILPPHSSLSLQPGAEGCHLRFDPQVFQTMVLMGVLNGAAYCRDDQNPEITLRTEMHVQKDFSDPRRSISPGTYCIVHIDSAGHELNEEAATGLCDPLRVGPNGAEDFGVGYAFAKKALQLVGGMIAATPLEGVGTRVSMYFPAVEQSAAVAPFASLSEAGYKGPPPTVLVVEDEEIVRQIVVRTLTRAGFNVVQASDGEEGLALVEEDPSRFQLVLTDLVMPGMDGRTLAEKIQGHLPRNRIVFMSGFTGEQLEIRRPENDGVHFIAKPFRPGGLIGVMYRALGIGSGAV